MEKDLLKFSSGEVEQDIQKYLVIPVNHLNEIILKLEKLSENETTKEHLIDVLKECFYYQQNLLSLKNDYMDDSLASDKEHILNQIKVDFKNIFNIEEELISDYPDFFSNQDNQWWQITYSPVIFSSNKQPVDIKSHLKNCLKIKILKIKKLSFGFFFLFPAFLLFISLPLLNDKINFKEDSTTNPVAPEYDRAYKNLFYLYSAVLSSKNSEDNFYTLIKTNSFKMPEGFVVIDKNVIADYYLKEYYGIKILENQPEVTILSVSNVNYIQCKYIITKFSGNSFYTIELNNKLVSLTQLKPEDNCISDTKKSNTVSLQIVKI